MYVFKRDPHSTDLPVAYESKSVHTESAAVASLYAGDNPYASDKHVLEAIRRGEVHDAESCEADFNTPEGMKLLPFQRVAVDEILRRKRMILADDMGLGKTVEVLTAIYNLKPDHVVIVCPTFLRTNWEKEARKWCPDYKVAVIDGGNTKVVQKPKLMLIAGYDILSRKNAVSEAFRALACDFLVLDEAHMVKNMHAKRTALLLGESENRLNGLASRAKYFVACTGTPIVKSFEDMMPLLLSTAPKTFKNARRFFIRKVLFYHSGKCRYKKQVVSIGMLRQLLLRSVLVRRTKEAVLKDLPDKTVTYIPYTGTKLLALANEENSVLSRLAEELGCSLEEAVQKASAFSMGGGGLRNLATIRKEQALLKAEQAADIIENMLESVAKVIVFAYHRDCIDLLHQRLGGVKMYGGMSKDAKDKAVEGFQHGEERVFIGQIDAAGTGLTLTASSYVVFVEVDWSPMKLSQAEDRAYRIGQKSNVNIYYLLAEGSIDSMIVRNMLPKLRLHGQLINGDVLAY